VNIHEATKLAMKEAIDSLVDKLEFDGRRRIHIIVDGNISLDVDFPCKSIVKGDARSKSIASASILAKVTRDRIMNLCDKIYPEYGLAKHKGYPTQEHRAILKKLGPSKIHRKSFSCV
jgi:ribonuclease HII